MKTLACVVILLAPVLLNIGKSVDDRLQRRRWYTKLWMRSVKAYLFLQNDTSLLLKTVNIASVEDHEQALL